MMDLYPTKKSNRVSGLPRTVPPKLEEMLWGNAARFLHYHGQEELSLAISNVNYLLQEIKFQGRKQSKNNELTSTRSIINLKVKCNAQSDFIPYDRYL